MLQRLTGSPTPYSPVAALLLATCLVTLSSGCGVAYTIVKSESKLDTLVVPMTKSQVVDEIGRPDRVLRDAVAVQEGGAFSIVLEGIPAQLGERISRELDIPTIGIGAGPGCDGQVLVFHDMLRLFLDFTPKFAKVYADVGAATQEALKCYCQEVRDGRFPAEEHCY